MEPERELAGLSPAKPKAKVFGHFGRTVVEIEQAAREEGLWPMTTDHWRVLQFVRAYYRDTGRLPALVHVRRATGLNLKQLFGLFPDGIVQTVLKLVGMNLPLELVSTCPYLFEKLDWGLKN